MAMAAPASAAVLTFDGLNGQFPGSTEYREAGFRVFSEGSGDFGGHGNLHVDIAMGPFTHRYSVARVDGRMFSLQSLNVAPLGTTFLYPDRPNDDVEITGFRGNTAVASLMGSAQAGARRLNAGSAFNRIDRLDITGRWTPNVAAAFNAGLVDDVHLAVDNVSLGAPGVGGRNPAAPGMATVPLPAGGALFLGALGMLALLRRARSRSAA